MRPSIDEQLRGIQRLIDTVARDEHLSTAGSEALVGASRALRRLEGTWSGVLPFLVADTRATASLLQSLSHVLPAQLSAEIDRATSSVPSYPDPSVFDVAVADERNGELRRLLAKAVAALPVTEHGEAARGEIAAHLRRRLDSDPASGRTKR
jgi:hypothetical protein